MPKAFETWTVCPHKPIEKLSENLWRVEGTMPKGSVRRIMTVARLRDGRLMIHNAIALDEPEMAELEAFGTPALLIVPNAFHRMDAKIYKDRYPKLSVLCPRGATKKVEQVVPVSGSYADAPVDEDVKLSHLDGCKEKEGVLEVRSADGRTLVFNDTLMNIPKAGGLMGFFLAPTGRPTVPRVARLAWVKDKRALRAHLERLAGADLQRVIPGHGALLTSGAGEALRAVATEL